MKEYRKDNKGFSLNAILVIIGVFCVIGYYTWQIYAEKAAKPKFQNLKKITQKIANSVQDYYFAHGQYPSKISELNAGLEVGYEGTNMLVGKGPGNIWCLILEDDKQVSCTQKIIGGRIGFFVNVKDLSTKCIAFSTNTKDLNNRLCKQEFKDFDPLLNHCENYSYSLNKAIMIKNNPAPDCEELLRHRTI